MKTVFAKTYIIYLRLSVAWSLKTCISLHVKSMALSKSFLPMITKHAALLWTFTLMAKRMLFLVLYFAPSLGLFNLLHHWQWEQIPFAIRKQWNVTADDELMSWWYWAKALDRPSPMELFCCSHSTWIYDLYSLYGSCILQNVLDPYFHPFCH